MYVYYLSYYMYNILKISFVVFLKWRGKLKKVWPNSHCCGPQDVLEPTVQMLDGVNGKLEKLIVLDQLS